jgi:hypothetical protein
MNRMKNPACLRRLKAAVCAPELAGYRSFSFDFLAFKAQIRFMIALFFRYFKKITFCRN